MKIILKSNIYLILINEKLIPSIVFTIFIITRLLKYSNFALKVHLKELW